MTNEDAVKFITLDCPDLKVTISDAKKCFFQAKMTVFDEIDNIDQHDQMKFVEFLEFLCRVAYYNFE